MTMIKRLEKNTSKGFIFLVHHYVKLFNETKTNNFFFERITEIR